MEIVLQQVIAKGLIPVKMLTYLLRAFLIRATVFQPLFTTRNACDHNTRILESTHHHFMSQYKHVVVSVYWSERVHEVTILAPQDRHAAGLPFSIARVYEMVRRLGGTDHWTFTGRGTLISYYKLQMRQTGCFNILRAIVNINRKGHRSTDNTILIYKEHQLITNDQHLMRGFGFSGMWLNIKSSRNNRETLFQITT